MESFENLYIEGILDDALRLDTPESPPPAPPPASPPTSPTAEADSMFSGLLDEALGAEKTESILDDALGIDDLMSTGPPTQPPIGTSPEPEDPIRDIEAELMGAELEPADDGADSNLSELIKTRVSISTDKITTAPPPSASQPSVKRVEVPVTVEVDGTEQEIELLLKMSLKRK